MEDMKDPGKNVQAGTMFLKLMIDAQGGDVEKGLAAYNGGITRLNRNGGDINKMPEETRNYVPKVLAALSGSGSATAAEAPSAAAEEASGEQPPITGDAATPSSVSIKRKQQYRKVKRLDKEIAKLEASLSGKDNDRVALAKRARIEQLGAERDAARAAAEAPGPESSDPSTPAEETVVAENPQQQKVADEMASAAPASSETEVVEAAGTLQAIRPAKRLSKKQRMAIYTLARTGAIPAQEVPRILESGRLTKANLTVMKNAAGQHIAYDEAGNARVLPETRAAIAAREAKLANMRADTAFKTIENQQQIAQRELDRTTQQEKRFDEQFKHFYHVEGDTEQANAKRRADMQDMVATTQSVYGINLNDHAGRTVMNKAKELQDRYAESQEFSLLNPFSWFRDEPIYGDFGPGVLAQQIPGMPHNIDDPDEQVAAMKYTYKYLEPLQQAGLQGKPLMVGGLLKARLEKAGISPEVSTPALIQVAQERPDLLDQPDVLLRNLQSYIQAANTP
jgi:soluble lytic murein transglycosylase-like protein